jgi:hypothetical protein
MKSNLILSAFIMLFLLGCKKTDTRIIESKKNVFDELTKQKILEIIKSPKNLTINNLNVNSIEVLDKNYLNEISLKISAIFPESNVRLFQEKLTSKIESIQFKNPILGNENKLKTETVEFDHLSYQNYLDVEEDIYEGVVTPIFDVTITTNLRSTINNIQTDLMQESNNFMDYAFNVHDQFDSNEFNNYITKINGVLNLHRYQINTLSSLNSSEKEVLNLALFAASENLQIQVNNFEIAFQTLFNDFNSQIQNNILNIKVDGFFGWLTRNFIAPLVTFVVTLTVGIGFMLGGTFAGLAIGGPVGGVLGLVTGIFASWYIIGPVRSFLNWGGFYNPKYDAFFLR